MRKSARALVLVVLAVLTSTVLGVASAFMASLALGATALIVPGTGTPNANIVTDYLKNANDRYIEPFNPVCANNGCNPTGVDYPAAFWPLFLSVIGVRDCRVTRGTFPWARASPTFRPH